MHIVGVHGRQELWKKAQTLAAIDNELSSASNSVASSARTSHDYQSPHSPSPLTSPNNTTNNNNNNNSKRSSILSNGSDTLIVKRIDPSKHRYTVHQPQVTINEHAALSGGKSTIRSYSLPHERHMVQATAIMDKHPELLSKELRRMKHLQQQQQNEISILKAELKSKSKSGTPVSTSPVDRPPSAVVKDDTSSSISGNNSGSTSAAVPDNLNTQLLKKREYEHSMSDIREKDRLLSEKIKSFMLRRLSSHSKLPRSNSSKSSINNGSSTLSKPKIRNASSSSFSSRSSKPFVSVSARPSIVISDFGSDSVMQHNDSDTSDTKPTNANADMLSIAESLNRKTSHDQSDLEEPDIKVTSEQMKLLTEALDKMQTPKPSKGNIKPKVYDKVVKTAPTSRRQSQISHRSVRSGAKLKKESSLGDLEKFQSAFDEVDRMIKEQEDIFKRLQKYSGSSLQSKTLSKHRVSTVSSSSVDTNFKKPMIAVKSNNSSTSTLSKLSNSTVSLRKPSITLETDEKLPVKEEEQLMVSDMVKDQDETTKSESPSAMDDSIADISNMTDHMLQDIAVHDIDIFLKKYGNQLTSKYSDDLNQIVDEIADQLIKAEFKT